MVGFISGILERVKIGLDLIFMPLGQIFVNVVTHLFFYHKRQENIELQYHVNNCYFLGKGVTASVKVSAM